jgi:hypothetical protein
MDHELTKYNTRLFAEKVLPHVRDIWDDEWQDHLAVRRTPADIARHRRPRCS